MWWKEDRFFNWYRSHWFASLLTLDLFSLKAAQWQVSVKSLTSVTSLESHLPVWTVFGLIISHGSKVMLKILQVRLQLNMNRELLDVQTGFRKGRETRDRIANICWTIEKAGEFQQNMYFCFKDYAKAFDCVDHNKLWKILQEMGIQDDLTYLLRNLYSDQEATVRTGRETTEWFQIGKGVHQGYILSPCLFNLYAEYIMWNARLDEAQLKSRFLGEISITSDMQMTQPLWQKVKRN